MKETQVEMEKVQLGNNFKYKGRKMCKKMKTNEEQQSVFQTNFI